MPHIDENIPKSPSSKRLMVHTVSRRVISPSSDIHCFASFNLRPMMAPNWSKSWRAAHSKNSCMRIELEGQGRDGIVIRLRLNLGLQNVEEFAINGTFGDFLLRSCIDELRDVDPFLEKPGGSVALAAYRRDERCIAGGDIVGPSEAPYELKGWHERPVRCMQRRNLQLREIVSLPEHIDADNPVHFAAKQGIFSLVLPAFRDCAVDCSDLRPERGINIHECVRSFKRRGTCKETVIETGRADRPEVAQSRVCHNCTIDLILILIIAYDRRAKTDPPERIFP